MILESCSDIELSAFSKSLLPELSLIGFKPPQSTERAVRQPCCLHTPSYVTFSFMHSQIRSQLYSAKHCLIWNPLKGINNPKGNWSNYHCNRSQEKAIKCSWNQLKNLFLTFWTVTSITWLSILMNSMMKTFHAFMNSMKWGILTMLVIEWTYNSSSSSHLDLIWITGHMNWLSVHLTIITTRQTFFVCQQ